MVGSCSKRNFLKTEIFSYTADGRTKLMFTAKNAKRAKFFTSIFCATGVCLAVNIRLSVNQVILAKMPLYDYVELASPPLPYVN
jgi:hypothetical protein